MQVTTTELVQSWHKWCEAHQIDNLSCGMATRKLVEMIEEVNNRVEHSVVNQAVNLPSDEACLKQAEYESQRGSTYSCPDSARAAFIHACDWYTSQINPQLLTGTYLNQISSTDMISPDIEKKEISGDIKFDEWLSKYSGFYPSDYEIWNAGIKIGMDKVLNDIKRMGDEFLLCEDIERQIIGRNHLILHDYLLAKLKEPT